MGKKDVEMILYDKQRNPDSNVELKKQDNRVRRKIRQVKFPFCMMALKSQDGSITLQQVGAGRIVLTFHMGTSSPWEIGDLSNYVSY